MHFLLSRRLSSFPPTTARKATIVGRGNFRYKILLELCEHATVVIGRQENSIAGLKSPRPSSELHVFAFWCR